MKDPICLQERYAPANACFGCGPANPQGLHVRSFAAGDEVVARWRPQPHHEAYPGVLNGGIIGALLDCHANWAAAWHLMVHAGSERPPCTVTAEYTIRMLKPTPTDHELVLRARIAEASGRKVVVEATLGTENDVSATCRGVFVAVKPGHPAYHRW
jgi:acyl-coenzyme A thioesterase PaaI-like protein